VQQRDDTIRQQTIAAGEREAAIQGRDAIIAEQGAAVAKRDTTIAEQASAIAQRDGTIAEQAATIAGQARTTAELEGLLVGGRGPGGHWRPHLLPACVTCPRLCAPGPRFVEHAMSCAGCTWGAAVRRQAAERAVVRQRDAALAERQRQLVGLRAGMFLCGSQRPLAKGTGGGG
jgi:hypothetical protein